MRRLKTLTYLLAIILVIQTAPLGVAQARAARSNSASTSAARKAAEAITVEQLKDYLYFIASDEMEGRDTPSRGLNLTAKFIAMNLSRWGIRPAGDNGTYFQKIALRRSRIAPADAKVEISGQTFEYGEGFLAAPIVASVSGSLVYVGHGWVLKKKNVNPYEGIDVKDKIMIVSGPPPGVDSFADLGGKENVDWFTPADNARRFGAKGIITLAGPATVAAWELTRKNQTERGSIAVERFAATNTPMPTVTASPRMVRTLLQGESALEGVAQEKIAEGLAKSFDLSTGKTATFNIKPALDTVFTQNVVGVLEGSDAKLKNEYVAIGAHYDHVGVGAPNGSEGRFAGTKDKTDMIYNGADDDGSGTVAVLAIAEAFVTAKMRPKRSLLFIWHCGEEKGLWGSQYFAETPSGSINLNQVVTQLNIDMIGRSKSDADTNPDNKELTRTNDIYVIGSKMMSTDLGELSERVNRGYLNLGFNYKYDDPNDPNQFFYRSDHFNYAKKGVPIIFYTDGEHEDYHRPSDSPDRIDYEQMLRVTRTIFMTAAELTDIPQRPRVDKKLPMDVSGN